MIPERPDPKRFLVSSCHYRVWRVDQFYPSAGKVNRMIKLPIPARSEASSAYPDRFGIQAERDLGKRGAVAIEELTLADPFVGSQTAVPIPWIVPIHGD